MKTPLTGILVWEINCPKLSPPYVSGSSGRLDAAFDQSATVCQT